MVNFVTLGYPGGYPEGLDLLEGFRASRRDLDFGPLVSSWIFHFRPLVSSWIFHLHTRWPIHPGSPARLAKVAIPPAPSLQAGRDVPPHVTWGCFPPPSPCIPNCNQDGLHLNFILARLVYSCREEPPQRKMIQMIQIIQLIQIIVFPRFYIPGQLQSRWTSS